MDTTYLPVTWQHYQDLSQEMAADILDRKGPRPQKIVAIGRGGLTLGHLLSDFLRIPIASITIQSYTDIKTQGEVKITEKLGSTIAGQHILLVDDIADTGKTLIRATKYLARFHPASIATATMFYKPHCTVKPDVFAEETDRWILLPFEVTEWITTFTGKMKTEGKSEEDIMRFLHELGYTDHQIAFVKKYYP
jgi:hypoxanthine phosphoribosyltransferase